MAKTLLFFALIFSSFASTQETLLDVRENNHRIFLDPDFFWCHRKWHNQEKKIRSKSFNYGLKGGYEYAAPNSLYFEIEGYRGIGTERLNVKNLEKNQTSNWTQDDLFTSLETGIGYNFNDARGFVLTPFVGLGAYFFQNFYISQFTFASIGFKYKTILNSFFDVGINWKSLKFLTVNTKYLDQKEFYDLTKQDFFGFEASFPLIWHVNSDGDRWDLQFEPYIQKLNIMGDETVLGSQILLGYYF